MAQKIVLQKPSRIQQAEDRLQSAIVLLENAIQDASSIDSSPDERVLALEAELEDLKLQNKNFRTLNDKVGSSLEKLIVRLKAVLKE